MAKKVHKPTYIVNRVSRNGRTEWYVSILDEDGEFHGEQFVIAKPRRGKHTAHYQVLDTLHRRSFPLFTTLRDAIFAVTA